MSDIKTFKIEESSEVRKKKRNRILTDIFVGQAQCTIETQDQYMAGVVGSELVSIKKSVGGVQRSIAYIESSTQKGLRYDEFHIQFPQVEPVVLEAVTKFFDEGLGKLQYDMPEITVIVHYERRKDKAEEEFKEMVKTSGRLGAVQRQMEKLDQVEMEEAPKLKEE
jgi:hypothetical protein